MDGRAYTRPDLPHDVFPTEQFLSFRTRLAGTMQRPADYTGIGIYFLHPTKWIREDGPANQHREHKLAGEAIIGQVPDG